MKHSRAKRVLTGVLAMVTATVLLSGCAGDGGGGQPATPKTVDTLRIAQSSDAQPGRIQSSQPGNLTWSAGVFETLTTKDEAGVPQPLLATEWKFAADDLSLAVTLRDDVTFHSGRTMTAEDVKFSFENAADPASGCQTGFIARSFTSIDVVSDSELVITFTQPTPNLFDFFEQAYIIDSETFPSLASGSEVVGTGPFTFDGWEPGSELSLSRYDDYWGDAASLKTVDVSIITDSTALTNAVRSGRADIAYGLTSTDAAAFAGDDNFRLAAGSSLVFNLGLNVAAGPFTDTSVRQAIGMAIDRERISSQVFADQGEPVDIVWEDGSTGVPEDVSALEPEFDPDRAKKMITAAGAEGASFEILVPATPTVVSIAEIVRNNLEAIGLAPTVTALEQTSFTPRLLANDVGAAYLGQNATLGLAPATLIDVVPGLRMENPARFASEEFTQLRTAIKNAADTEATEEAVADLTEFLIDEEFFIPLVRAESSAVVSKNVSDVPRTSRNFYLLGDVTVSE